MQCLINSGVDTLVVWASCFRITEAGKGGGLHCQYSVYPGIKIVTQLCHHSILDLITVLFLS